MNSLEKVDAFKAALLRDDTVHDGLLGLVQGIVAGEALGGPSITSELPDDPAEFDAALLDVAGFVLYLRSDDAPTFDPTELAERLPAEIRELAIAHGIESPA